MNETELLRSAGNTGVDRRTLLRGAAWAAPVVAIAVAAPLASASVANAGLAWTGSETGLLSLRLLDGASLITAQALVTVPNEFTLSNGPGAITNQTATVTVVVARPAGINLPVGRARGFGVYSLGGTVVASQNTAVYQSAPIIGQYGFPLTTFVGTHVFNVASGAPLEVPIEFGLSGNSTGASISLLATFPVTLTVDFGNGNSYSATSTISVPVGAGIL